MRSVSVRPQQRPDQRHRLAPRAPAADADRHPARAAGRRPRRRVIVLSVTAAPASAARVRSPKVSRTPVGDPAEVRLEGEALLEAVAAAHVDRVDAVDGGLGQPEQLAVLGGDLARPAPGPRPRSSPRGTTCHTEPCRVQLGGGRRCARCSTGRASGAGGPAGPDGWPRRARPGPARAARTSASSLATIASALPTRPMPPPRQKPCTAATTGHLAVVDGGERLGAAAVGADQRLVPRRRAASP